MDHLGEAATGARILAALHAVTGEGKIRTPDLGGKSTTQEFTDAVVARLERPPNP
jgi:isocitrate/isopropylmalate dehydrogenase